MPNAHYSATRNRNVETCITERKWLGFFFKGNQPIYDAYIFIQKPRVQDKGKSKVQSNMYDLRQDSYVEKDNTKGWQISTDQGVLDWTVHGTRNRTERGARARRGRVRQETN